MTSSGWSEVTATEPCELCGSTHWCARNGSAFTCRKLSEHPTLGRGLERTDKAGATFWLFTRRDPERKPSSPGAILKPLPDRADADMLHNAYTAALSRLPWPIDAQREL